MVAESIKIRPYQAGDERGINALFNKVFQQSRPLAEWCWKFLENPANTKLTEWIVVAESQDIIVGHYASLVMDMQCGNTIMKAGQPVDTMIDPSVKRGAKLLQELYTSHVKHNNGVAIFGFGFPNEIAYKVGKRFLGYRDLSVMIQYFKRLSLRSAINRKFPRCPAWLVGLVHRMSQIFYQIQLPNKESQNYTVEKVTIFDDGINKLWNEIKDRFGIVVIRNTVYLNWRYQGKTYTILLAKRGQEIKGYVVLKIKHVGQTKVGYIIDFLAKDQVNTFLLNKALRFFISQDVDYVLCGLLREDPLAESLTRIGFRQHPGFSSFPVVWVPLSPTADQEYLREPENWHLAYGDIDGF